MTDFFIIMELIGGLVKLLRRLLAIVKSVPVVNGPVIYLMSIELAYKRSLLLSSPITCRIL